MNKNIKLVIGIFAFGIAAFSTSCKKKSSPSAASNLEGTWTISKEYVDTNNNKQPDANELFTDTSMAHQFLDFMSNGTMTQTYYGNVSTGTWAFLYSNTYLAITDTSNGGSITYFQVLTLTSSSLEIKDTTNAANGGTSWIYLTKQ